MHRASEIKIRLDSSKRDSSWNACAQLPPPTAVLWCDEKTLKTRLFRFHGIEKEWDDPLTALDWMAGSMKADERWVGFLSYDLGELLEPRGNRGAADLPLFVFTLHSETDFHQPVMVEHSGRLRDEALRCNFSRAGYERAVAKAVEYIRAGDIFQVNLSQRFTVGMRASPQFIYDRLREEFDAEFGACLIYGDLALMSNSPELFLRISPDRKIITRPIKGTRPALAGMEVELRDSEKDQAELNMIVDLERNDLGRICEIGSVKVAEPRIIERHPTVYHGVATIEGILQKDVTFSELLRATFPGGSVTGAPKIRAMEIIQELEGMKRGPYCGAIGYLSASGGMEFNVAIRTMIVQDGLAHFSVGGGIVADSNPAEEYEETLVKAKAMFAALGVSENHIALATRGN